MNETPFLPDPQQVKQTLAKAHRACQDMELAGLELQEVIEILERNIREQTSQAIKAGFLGGERAITLRHVSPIALI